MLPKRLKAARQAKDMTQETLGKLAGIDEATAGTRISQYERGTHTPEFRTLKRIADVLDMPVAYFYTEGYELSQKLLRWHEKAKGFEYRKRNELEELKAALNEVGSLEMYIAQLEETNIELDKRLAVATVGEKQAELLSKQLDDLRQEHSSALELAATLRGELKSAKELNDRFFRLFGEE